MFDCRDDIVTVASGESGIEPIDFANSVFKSVSKLVADSSATLVEDSTSIIDAIKAEMGLTVPPGSKSNAKVRISLKPQEIPNPAPMITNTEMDDAFYSAYDEYQFVKDRELVARTYPIEKEKGLYIDDNDSYTIRGLEDKSLPISKRVRRAEHSLKVLKEHQDSIKKETAAGKPVTYFSGSLHETARKSSQSDARRAYELAQQDTIAAMEALIESYVDLRNMDQNVLPLLTQRMDDTRTSFTEGRESSI